MSETVKFTIPDLETFIYRRQAIGLYTAVLLRFKASLVWGAEIARFPTSMLTKHKASVVYEAIGFETLAPRNRTVYILVSHYGTNGCFLKKT